ncbi:TonB-dependent receptor [Aliiglaciecola sp. CAU 1673]|uniref:TonB-dependent receptor n=1 Tax=Aliiglaciecola sp. CAU 1673 TaxID=3032595 RepID=UPI0023DC47A1|nr:TonB-dependent receptor [Aliiglaciecola sp. CAU 1673]MDF2176690.1 TonB-dependent receptor [Aliiglaciecola sp. CAU 1673]
MRARFNKHLTAIAVAASLGIAQPVIANTTSNIVGTVQAQSPQDLMVTATDKATGRSREISIDADGEFRFAQLPPGQYVVTISRNGAVVASQDIRLSLGSNANPVFNLMSADTEVIEVTGARVSAVDLSTTDSGLVIGEVELDRMPVPRNLTGVSLLAAGTVSGDSNFSSPNDGGLASFGGSSVAENSCYINGMEVTNTSQGLGCGSVPFEFYKEFQVKTGGYSAQFGRTTGGVINAITKSGSNEWEFAATTLYTPKALREDGQVSYGGGGANGPVIFRDTRNDEYGEFEYTLSASGPIIEDKLFFYAIVNPRDVENNFAFQSSARQQYSPDNRFIKRNASGGDNLFWGAKFDWFVTDDHKLSLFGYSDRNDTTSETYRYDPITEQVGDLLGTTLRKRGGDVKSLSYVGNFTEDLTISALVGEIETEYTNEPDNLDCPSVADTRDIPEAQRISSCGTGGRSGDNIDTNTQYRFDVEYYVGDHLLRIGYDKQERDTFHTTEDITGHNWTYSTLLPNASIQGNSGALYTNNTGAPLDYVSDRIFQGGGSFTTDLNAWYIEDEWQVTDNLKLNIGVRQDEFINKGSTGKTFVSFKTDVAPRLGFSWDPTGAGNSKVYGTWGRYYLPVPNNTNYRAAAGISDSTTYYTFSGSDSTGAPTGLTPIAVGNSTVVNSVPNPVVQDIFLSEEAEPFSKDELILGYEQQLNDDMAVSVRGIRREVATGLDDYCGPLAPVNCVLLTPGKANTWWQDDDNDSVPDEGSRRTFSAEEIGLPEAKNEYTAIQTEFKYRADALRLNVGYTWSRSVGNFEGAVKSDIGQRDPGVTQDFDFPALMDGAEGYQANDRRHVFKFFGSYDVTEDLTLGFNSTLSSGRPLSAFGQGYPDHTPTIYGSYGDTFYLYTNQCPDANGDGQCQQDEKLYTRVPRGTLGRTPWTFNLDLSASYSFELSGVDMRANLNVYNILNAGGVVSQNEHYEGRRSEGSYNPYYGAAYYWQTPRYVQIGVEARF